MDSLTSFLPEKWRNFLHILIFPAAWPFISDSGHWWLNSLKILFLALPLLLFTIAVIATCIGLITVIFRPNRTYFTATLLITWWDAGKSVLNYWAGIFRFLFLAFGWIGGGIRLVILGLFQTIKDVIFLPATTVINLAKGYASPGVPWIAVAITIMWILLESACFSYILAPLVIDVIAGLTNTVLPRALAMSGLFIFLSMLIGGSFACMHGLVDAFKKREVFNIVKMLIIEFFVLFIEVMFFYREFVDSLAPWLAQMTNDSVHLGLGSILAIAAMSWIGVRSGTWFFFGKYGTPTLLMIISREGMKSSEDDGNIEGAPSLPLTWIKRLRAEVKDEIDWFSEKGKEITSSFVLPPVQILAVITNFCMIILTGKNLFNIPIKTVEELKDTKQLIEKIAEKEEKKQ